MWLHRFCLLQLHGRRPARQSRRTRAWRLFVTLNCAEDAVPDAAATSDSPSNRRISKEQPVGNPQGQLQPHHPFYVHSNASEGADLSFCRLTRHQHTTCCSNRVQRLLWCFFRMIWRILVRRWVSLRLWWIGKQSSLSLFEAALCH